MPRRRHTPDQIIRKLREADRMLGEGRPTGPEKDTPGRTGWSGNLRVKALPGRASPRCNLITGNW